MKPGEKEVLLPLDVVEAAQRVTRYFEEQDIRGWSLAGCSDRNTVEAYRALHLACLRLVVASDDEADTQDRVAASRVVWRAMMDAMDALPGVEKYIIAGQMTDEEAEGMEATADKLALLAQGRRPS